MLLWTAQSKFSHPKRSNDQKYLVSKSNDQKHLVSLKSTTYSSEGAPRARKTFYFSTFCGSQCHRRGQLTFERFTDLFFFSHLPNPKLHKDPFHFGFSSLISLFQCDYFIQDTLAKPYDSDIIFGNILFFLPLKVHCPSVTHFVGQIPTEIRCVTSAEMGFPGNL